MHGQGPELIDIVDEEWRNENIEFQEIEIGTEVLEQNEEIPDDKSEPEDEFKWRELGFKDLVK